MSFNPLVVLFVPHAQLTNPSKTLPDILPNINNLLHKFQSGKILSHALLSITTYRLYLHTYKSQMKIFFAQTIITENMFWCV